jgi:hypothetical protein
VIAGDEEDGAVWWPSPYGPGRCLVCPVHAAVVVRDPNGEEADLCAEHWDAAQRAAAGLLHVVRAIPARRDFR